MKTKSFARGFTLIELMVVVLVLGIIASLALPAYEEYGLRARRAVAKAFISQMSLKEEENFVHNRTYTEAIGTGGLGLTSPGEVAAFYTFSICGPTTACAGRTAPTGGYVILATRINRQTRDSVGELVYYSTGRKCTTLVPDSKWGNDTASC